MGILESLKSAVRFDGYVKVIVIMSENNKNLEENVLTDEHVEDVSGGKHQLKKQMKRMTINKAKLVQHYSLLQSQ